MYEAMDVQSMTNPKIKDPDSTRGLQKEPRADSNLFDMQPRQQRFHYAVGLDIFDKTISIVIF
jgi:hypothetical protein